MLVSHRVALLSWTVELSTAPTNSMSSVLMDLQLLVSRCVSSCNRCPFHFAAMFIITLVDTLVFETVECDSI